MQGQSVEPNEGYQNQWELLCDLFVWLDITLYFYYVHHQWLGPSSDMKNMLGTVVTREEFEYQLSKAAQCGLCDQVCPEETEQIEQVWQTIARRLQYTDYTKMPLLQLFERFGLDAFVQQCVILAYAVVLDRKYEKLLAYLQDDMTHKTLDTALAVQLFLPRGGNMEQFLMYFHRTVPGKELFEPDALAQGMLVLRPMVLSYLSTGHVETLPGMVYFDGAIQRPSSPLLVQHTVANWLDMQIREQDCGVVCLSGASGSGKRFQIEHLFSRHQARGIFWTFDQQEWRTQAEQAALAARLQGAYLCICRLETRTENGERIAVETDILQALSRLDIGKRPLFWLSERPIHIQLPHFVTQHIPELTEQERMTLFQAHLGAYPLGQDVALCELAAKFVLCPRQIGAACEQAIGLARQSNPAVVDSAALHQACYQQLVHRLHTLAQRVPAAYTWEDVVLPPAHKRLMQQACGHVQHRYEVYTTWRFADKVPYGRGLCMLFAGAPGTGKTMCAQVIANTLHMELYQINLSQIVSKYIGETEKNLQAVFEEAKHANAILFFDECDAIFGKRSEVKDSHDRNANIEVAYLLQQIEAYDGVCILATNFIGNIDAAFLRRISYIIHFPMPDVGMREQIYQRMMPKGAPVADDIDWKFLAQTFELSGGHIKNIVLVAAFMAAEQGQPISMRHLLRAAVGEMKKHEIVVVRESLREYADLLEEETSQ